MSAAVVLEFINRAWGLRSDENRMKLVSVHPFKTVKEAEAFAKDLSGVRPITKAVSNWHKKYVISESHELIIYKEQSYEQR